MHEPCEKVIAMEATVEARHKGNLWFIGILGTILLIASSIVVTMGSRTADALASVTKQQVQLSTTQLIIIEEVKGLRSWRLAQLNKDD